MGVNLNPLHSVPSKPVSVDKVIYGPVSDIGIVAEPRTAKEDNSKEKQHQNGENIPEQTTPSYLVILFHLLIIRTDIKYFNALPDPKIQ